MAVLVHFDLDATWGGTRVCDKLITRDLISDGLALGSETSSPVPGEKFS